MARGTLLPWSTAPALHFGLPRVLQTGLIPSMRSPIPTLRFFNYRHFISCIDTSASEAADMSEKERAGCACGCSQAVETVLKAGEVMYLPLPLVPLHCEFARRLSAMYDPP
jgi:hypothetical protein